MNKANHLYRVYFTNFGYYSQEKFNTLDSALEYGKSKCFEFQVTHELADGWECRRVVASWSPIGGLRTI
jgi:hypothetical protein